jgi:hypothetical protein
MNRKQRLAVIEALAKLDRVVARTKLRLKAMDERDTAPPPSESQYWRPKGDKPHDDDQWLKDGGWSGKR